MTTHERVRHMLEEMRHHLYKELLPFWTVRGVDKQYGGFLTYLDQDGNPTGETLKTIICQAAHDLYVLFRVPRGRGGEGIPRHRRPGC